MPKASATARVRGVMSVAGFVADGDVETVRSMVELFGYLRNFEELS